MAIDTDLSSAKKLAARKANDIIELQVNLKAPATNALKSMELAGFVHNVNLRDGILGSVGIVSDGGAYPTASSSAYEQLQVTPKLFMANLSVPLIHAMTVSGAGDSPDSVLEQIEAAANALAWELEGSVLDGYIGAVSTGATSGTSHALTCSGYGMNQVKVGQQVDVFDTSGSALFGGVITVAAVSKTASTITLTSSTTIDIDAGDVIYLKGFYNSGFASIADASGSGDLYGVTVGSSFGWSGQEVAAGGAMTEDLLSDLATKIFDEGGDAADLFFLSPTQHRALRQDAQGSRRFMDSSMDSYGDDFEKSKVMGQRVVVSSACPSHKALAVNSDAVKLGKFAKGKVLNLNISGDYDYNSSAAAIDIRRAIPANLIVKRRSCVGVLSGLTF